MFLLLVFVVALLVIIRLLVIIGEQRLLLRSLSEALQNAMDYIDSHSTSAPTSLLKPRLGSASQASPRPKPFLLG